MGYAELSSRRRWLRWPPAAVSYRQITTRHLPADAHGRSTIPPAARCGRSPARLASQKRTSPTIQPRPKADAAPGGPDRHRSRSGGLCASTRGRPARGRFWRDPSGQTVREGRKAEACQQIELTTKPPIGPSKAIDSCR